MSPTKISTALFRAKNKKKREREKKKKKRKMKGVKCLDLIMYIPQIDIIHYVLTSKRCSQVVVFFFARCPTFL